jgi:hypothetical protein
MRPFRARWGEIELNVASNLSRFRDWAKRLAGAFSGSQRTEITIQTDRLVLIRGRRSRRVWCASCGHEVNAIAMREVTPVAGRDQLVLPGNTESEAWHVCIANDGETLICLDSLSKTG